MRARTEFDTKKDEKKVDGFDPAINVCLKFIKPYGNNAIYPSLTVFKDIFISNKR